ncbi:hypothetical protein BT93_G0611 [Corymbia citriodora subsp. variegata]|nr:hypothetical protein BT93_G0611 [Corymbia citriodora subsp. variegata]
MHKPSVEICYLSIVRLKNKVNKLKRQYSSFKKLLSQSGFGWNNVNNMVDVANQSDNSEWAKFRNDGFPQYLDLCIVFGNEYVVGNTKKVAMSSEGDDNGGDGGGDVIGDVEELDEHPVDDGAFMPNVTITLSRQKHKLDRIPNSKRRRKNNTYDVSSAYKAIQKIIKFKTNQSTNGFVTSNVPSPIDPYSIEAMNLYNKAMNQLCLNATRREAFIISLPERRRGLLESL